ncbi:hypothetical protein H4R20_002389 [Coemansia guatemalensis]|uniref:Choline/carnitine acyltransferase domain-containing protein n=1 Tax=Coemansia guatemalensis TaxID=2761395 RepID=A0A9W8LU09_9FUNG|nr:hypothetical protein H4R20_002389 [Coemansia guatemalensis]
MRLLYTTGTLLRASTFARGVSTFARQAELPRLPLPALEDTVARYVRSVKPLLNSTQLAQTERAAAAFVGGIGPELQQRLREVDARAKGSWLEEIWLRKAYLEGRAPCYVHSNWAGVLSDPPTSVATAGPGAGRATGTQIQRAARLAAYLLENCDALVAETMAPDEQRGVPQCMNQMRWQFGTTRIPRAGCDELRNQDPPTARHIVLMYRGQAAEVPVYDSAGRRASPTQIAEQLACAVRAVDAMPEGPSVASLTATDRDAWARARGLLARDAVNRRALESIESALFIVCLDDGPEATKMEGRLATMMHAHGNNRWFDKAIQLVVLPSGCLGVNCEHAPVDALTTVRLLVEALDRERSRTPANSTASSELPEPTALRWAVSWDVAQAIDDARIGARDLADDLRMLVCTPGTFGAQWIKSIGASPDAFFQVAVQAAHFRLHGRPAPTYESASMRHFHHGRTETIRSCTSEALAFSRALADREAPLRTKLHLFRAAIAAQVDYAKAVAAGAGVDRHLLALRVQLRDADEARRAALFEDPAYALSSSYTLSTSNVTTGGAMCGAFAPVVPGGYGIAYSIDPDAVSFRLSDWHHSAETDAPAFRDAIYSTLADLHAAAEHAKGLE